MSILKLARGGLSPRGRGNLSYPLMLMVLQRSIPAWAGEPSPPSPSDSKSTVYPRVGGGTLVELPISYDGRGLSPRGRGNPNQAVHDTNDAGSIPAWAGEPPRQPSAGTGAGVYPRVGGGTPMRYLCPITGAGLSPRGRGNRQRGYRTGHALGSIPAWAGEPRLARSRSGKVAVYPRVGGGTPKPSWTCRNLLGLSPRGRGNPSRNTRPTGSKGSIPAWAGEPDERRTLLPLRRVYPRVGGGTPFQHGHVWQRRGLSPRGRGNHVQAVTNVDSPRSIPAWAGEPP